MTTQGPTALPPTTVHTTKVISQSAAHEFLTAYLTRAAIDPALQPNASISENGPVTRSTAAAPNLILHNLKRVQAGLAGEILGRDLTVAKQNPGEEYLDIAAGVVPAIDTSESQDVAEDDLSLKDTQYETEERAFKDQEQQQAAIDKEERKKKKKERRQAEKRAKAQKVDD